MNEKKSALGKILTFIGLLTAIGAMVYAVIHFWEDLKAKLSRKDDQLEDLEEFVEDELDLAEEVAEEVQDDMEDFVEFEEL